MAEPDPVQFKRSSAKDYDVQLLFLVASHLAILSCVDFAKVVLTIEMAVMKRSSI